MNTSAEAADQIVRMTLTGTEAAMKITGKGAEKIGRLLYRLLRDLAKETKKTKGQMRLSNMIKSGKKLDIFEIPDANLKRFCELAKSHGVTYCILKDKSGNDGFTEIMVKTDDSQKINHIFRRLEMAVNNVSRIETSLGLENTAPEKSQEDTFAEELMREPATYHEASQNPSSARPEKSALSVPLSENNANKTITEQSEPVHKPRSSVRAELKKYREEDKTEPELKNREKEKTQRPLAHKHIEKKKKPKIKVKERG